MISVQVGGPSDLARQGAARHRLFVEGSAGDNIDFVALQILLPNITIEVMGPSFHLKSVSTALHPHHPDYYFLIDRDHHSDDEVNASWDNFPDETKSNLLIWRKKEIENYFLDPDYLQKSQWIKNSFKEIHGRQKLEQQILIFANKRLFLDVANSVLLTIREGQKTTWVETFTNPDDFPDAVTARQKLVDCDNFQDRKKSVALSVRKTKIMELFDSKLKELSGGNTPLTFASGCWASRMNGKEILRQTVNTCFAVKNAQGQNVQGDEKYIEVIKDLMRQDINNQPQDFQDLVRLIEARISTE